MNYDLIPQYTIDSIDRYVSHGVHPGDFVLAVLTNNLQASFHTADTHNLAALKEIVGYVRNKIPRACHGGPEMVFQWMRLKLHNQEPEL